MTTLLVDAMNIFVRSYVVVPSMSEHGHHVGGTLGFLKSLGSYCRRFSPDRVIVVWEGGGSSRRRALLKDYKANRKPVRLNRSDIYDPSEIPILNLHTCSNIDLAVPYADTGKRH